MEKIPHRDPPGGTPMAILEKIDAPKDKPGIYSYFRGYKYPYKGFPQRETVKVMDVSKDVYSILLVDFAKKFWKLLIVPFGLLFLLFRKTFYKLVDSMLNIILRAFVSPLMAYRLKPERYCRSVREMYRVWNLLAEREKLPIRSENWRLMRDVFCMWLEFDNSWRYRFQDIMSEINMDEIRFDEEDLSFIAVREPWEYRYDSAIDYTEWDATHTQEEKDRAKIDAVRVEAAKSMRVPGPERSFFEETQ